VSAIRAYELSSKGVDTRTVTVDRIEGLTRGTSMPSVFAPVWAPAFAIRRLSHPDDPDGPHE